MKPARIVSHNCIYDCALPVHGDHNVIMGSGNAVYGDDNLVIGDRNCVYGLRNHIIGHCNQLVGMGYVEGSRNRESLELHDRFLPARRSMYHK